MSARSFLTVVAALLALASSQLLVPSGVFVSSKTLATVRGGGCYFPFPVTNNCTECLPLDDPPTIWGECNAGGPSYDCQDYTNPNPHYGVTTCHEQSSICGGSRYEYSDECETFIGQVQGCSGGLSWVRTFDADYGTMPTLIPHCPL